MIGVARVLGHPRTRTYTAAVTALLAVGCYRRPVPPQRNVRGSSADVPVAWSASNAQGSLLLCNGPGLGLRLVSVASGRTLWASSSYYSWPSINCPWLGVRNQFAALKGPNARDLSIFNTNGRIVRRLPLPRGAVVASEAASRDGRHLAAVFASRTRAAYGVTTWLLNGSSEVATTAYLPDRILPGTTIAVYPAWSPSDQLLLVSVQKAAGAPGAAQPLALLERDGRGWRTIALENKPEAHGYVCGVSPVAAGGLLGVVVRRAGRTSSTVTWMSLNLASRSWTSFVEHTVPAPGIWHISWSPVGAFAAWRWIQRNGLAPSSVQLLPYDAMTRAVSQPETLPAMSAPAVDAAGRIIVLRRVRR